MTRHPLKFLSYYITNVCPKTCDNCSTFNNLRFKNHLKWEDNKDAAAKWYELLDVEEFSIMGGEPLLHPQIEEWALGLKSIWHEHTDFRVVSGVSKQTLLDKKELVKKFIKAGIILELSVHDPNEKDELISVVENVILKEYFDELKITRQAWTIKNDWPQEQLFFYYGDRLLVIMNYSWIFAKGAIKEIKDSTIWMHDSDKNVAHENCAWRDCHYLVEGRLYKCLVTGVGSLLKEQFTLDVQSKNLLDQSTSVSPFDPPDIVNNFLTTIGNVVDQCSLCPEDHTTNLIHIYPASPTKIKV